MTASAFSTTVVTPASGFAVIAGETVIGGLHGGDADHHHCDWCKSWVFTMPPAEFGFVNVRATLLDEAGWFAPWLETQTDEKLPWAVTGASRQFGRFPGADEYAGLIAEYRTDRAAAAQAKAGVAAGPTGASSPRE